MLSDEEREAIKNLRLNVTNVGFSVYDGTTSLFKMRDIQTILNLIEKQSKEIEELNKSLMTATLKIEGLKIEAVYNDNYISKDKIKEILEIEEKIDNETLLSLLQTIVDENARLEDIEDRKVQIEYNNVFNKGVKSVEDKIKAKIEEQEKIINTGGIDFNTKSYARCKKEFGQSLLEKG